MAMLSAMINTLSCFHTQVEEPDEAEFYDEAARRFDEPALAQLIFAITAINSWNRIAVTTQLQPPTR